MTAANNSGRCVRATDVKSPPLEPPSMASFPVAVMPFAISSSATQ